jgi:hypothetical protein
MVMMMLYKLMQLGITNKNVHLFDTFEGMTEPCDKDVDVFGKKAIDMLDEVKCEASYEDVYANISSVGYPMDKIHFHKGDIRKVNADEIPNEIALLRLDNDWYELYKFELERFEPHVIVHGTIIIDDYYHWKGCKEAVDEYLLKIGSSYNKNRLVTYSDCTHWHKETKKTKRIL